MWNLSKETIKNLEGITGLSTEKIGNLSLDGEIASVEKKTGNSLKFPKNTRLDGMRIRTLEEVDRGLDKIIKHKDYILEYYMMRLKVKNSINFIKTKLLSELFVSELIDDDEMTNEITSSRKVAEKLTNENNHKVKTKKRGCNKNV